MAAGGRDDLAPLIPFAILPVGELLMEGEEVVEADDFSL